jgi:hypothetical protein
MAYSPFACAATVCCIISLEEREEPMIRSLFFVSVALAAASCQATILSKITVSLPVTSEPASVPYGEFGTFISPFGNDGQYIQTPFAVDTDYYIPFGDLHFMDDMVTHPANYEIHGSMWINVSSPGLGNSYQFHYSRLDDNFTDNTCSSALGGTCAGSLTVAGTPEVYTVPWNQVTMSYNYSPMAGGGFQSNVVVTISNVPEPAPALLVGFGMIAAPFFDFRRRR